MDRIERTPGQPLAFQGQMFAFTRVTKGTHLPTGQPFVMFISEEPGNIPTAIVMPLAAFLEMARDMLQELG